MKNASQIPQPFLGPLFEPGVEPVIATGYEYQEAEIAVHGVKNHNAIDFDLPRETKILAPADGWYQATYGEALLRDDDGRPRQLSKQQALKTNPANQDINPPSSTGEWKIWFGSFVVQAWHGRGRYTQYAHVDWVNPSIPYYPPEAVVDEAGQKTGDLRHSLMLRATVDQYRLGKAVFLRTGEIIAEVGMTGCGWGKRCYDSAKFDKDGRPDFRGVDYTYYTNPHLHLAVFGQRAPRTRNPQIMVDPFGIYGDFEAGYPKVRSQWNIRQPKAQHAPLWLNQ